LYTVWNHDENEKGGWIVPKRSPTGRVPTVLVGRVARDADPAARRCVGGPPEPVHAIARTDYGGRREPHHGQRRRTPTTVTSVRAPWARKMAANARQRQRSERRARADAANPR
jgi:hypothetical protein